MRIALLGPPGAGKGTQATRICEAFSLVHLSSGDILRSEKTAGTPLGLQIRDYINNGLLVPDDVMVNLMKNKILDLGSRGFVLDGFPRTLSQAQTLTRILSEIARPLELVINMVVEPEVLEKRFEGRRMCPVCFAGYHVEKAPPKVSGLCDHDQQTLITREDDRPEVIRKRIKTYQETMSPLISYYTQLGNFKTIDASASVDDVSGVMRDKIQRHFDE